MKKVLLSTVILLATVTLLALPGKTKLEKTPKLQNWENIRKKIEEYKSYSYTTKSNVSLWMGNDGSLALRLFDYGYDDRKQVLCGQFIWPKGSNNQYIFGSGLWFGAQKWLADSNRYEKIVNVSYTPNMGLSYYIPGVLEDGDTLAYGKKDKYRVYRSSDYDLYTGIPNDTISGPNWPLWINPTSDRYYFSTPPHDYVVDVNQRNIDFYPKGPMFISDEDFNSVMKDTYYSMIEDDSIREKYYRRGYPLRTEVEQRVYSWETGNMKDVIVVSYIIENKSEDTIYHCYVAHVSDADIGHYNDTLPKLTVKQAENDYARFYSEDSTLNMGYVWSAATNGDSGYGLGYMGLSLLETPAVDDNGFVRNDKVIFLPEEQLGSKSFPIWKISDNKRYGKDRYDLMSKGLIENSTNQGDYRVMLSAGPFNMAPGDKAHFTVAITFAMPAKGGEADGTVEDITGIKGTEEISAEESSAMATKFSLIGKNYTVKEKYYESIAEARILEEIQNAKRLYVYPNPSSDVIYLSQVLTEADNFYIYDMSGAIVLGGTTSQKIDISNLECGAYLLYIDGNIYKFVKK